MALTTFNKDLSYEVAEDGYDIYLEGTKWMVQHEPNILWPDVSYEENAIKHCEQIVEDKKNSYLEIISNTCRQTIENGKEIEMSVGTKAFSFKDEDQRNISTLFLSILQTPNLDMELPLFPYHANGEGCTLYSGNDISKLYFEMQNYITYHTTYCNLLCMQIKEEFTKDTETVYEYGMPLKEEYQTQLNAILNSTEDLAGNIQK